MFCFFFTSFWGKKQERRSASSSTLTSTSVSSCRHASLFSTRSSADSIPSLTPMSSNSFSSSSDWCATPFHSFNLQNHIDRLRVNTLKSFSNWLFNFRFLFLVGQHSFRYDQFGGELHRTVRGRLGRHPRAAILRPVFRLWNALDFRRHSVAGEFSFGLVFLSNKQTKNKKLSPFIVTCGRVTFELKLKFKKWKVDLKWLMTSRNQMLVCAYTRSSGLIILHVPYLFELK